MSPRKLSIIALSATTLFSQLAIAQTSPKDLCDSFVTSTLQSSNPGFCRGKFDKEKAACQLSISQGCWLPEGKKPFTERALASCTTIDSLNDSRNGSELRDGKLKVDTGQRLASVLVAQGTQNYTCKQIGDEWKWDTDGVAPDAALVDAGGRLVGHHFKGLGRDGKQHPQWQFADGATCTAEKKDKGDARPGTILALRIKTADDKDAAVPCEFSTIQRGNTMGGAAPDAGTCNQEIAGDASKNVAKVPYRAKYYFYTDETKHPIVAECLALAKRKQEAATIPAKTTVKPAPTAGSTVEAH